MKAWPFRPGVPAAGHVTSKGAWHPGAISGCPKCPQSWFTEHSKTTGHATVNSSTGQYCMDCDERPPA